MNIHSSIIKDGDMTRLACNSCGKAVSTPFLPMRTDTPDGGLIVRAWIQCPECMIKGDELNQSQKDYILTYAQNSILSDLWTEEEKVDFLTTLSLSILHLADDTNGENQNQLSTDGPQENGGPSSSSTGGKG